jgi:hypothetical protein
MMFPLALRVDIVWNDFSIFGMQLSIEYLFQGRLQLWLWSLPVEKGGVESCLCLVTLHKSRAI